MGRFLDVDDLTPFSPGIGREKAEAMIADVEAVAVRLAPCLSGTIDESAMSAAKSILRRAVLRWDDQGSGAFQSQTAGPFGMTMDTRQQASRGVFFPSEEDQLRALCTASGGRRARSGWLL